MVIGCAQVAGLDKTTCRDAGIDGKLDARRDAAVDARVCTGGDARIVDEMTGTCYALFTTPLPRNEARAMCLTLGSGTVLASVQSANENQLITGLLGTNVAFLGGTDEVTEGMFTWEDGSAVVLTNWNAMEPNNGLGMYEEDCIVISGANAGKWDDRPCAPGAAIAGAYAFVCERN